ncbi:hypothetical protein PCCS19_05850 [Paenibacillus sp. CCS19]|uniref:hypothetical protein n=1 Tax=Paenibacillus sp. CCS19 TaxID=3158387 RepID=UPI00256C8597|nr:hypothetical protein [Paenibacillus cellulosilyticus]GMK37531.1 hypothetical protein PCCS19_05850 [Paenibacillus cellulosilyticus]
MMVWDAVISSTSGLIGAAVGYFGAVSAAKAQIREERKKEMNLEVEKRKRLGRSIQLFLTHEIETNMSRVHCKELTQLLQTNEKPFSYKIPDSVFLFNFSEYDRVKYELIMLDDEEGNSINLAYNLFYYLRQLTDINELSEQEYERVRVGYFSTLDFIYKAKGVRL